MIKPDLNIFPTSAARHTPRVFLALRHPIYRAGLSRYLAASRLVTLIGQSADGREAIDACREDQVDVLILEYQLQNQNGLEVAAAVSRPDDRGGVCIIALLEVPEKHVVWGFLSAGVTHLLSKSRSEAEILQAISEADQHLIQLDPPIQAVVARSVRAIMPPITAREKELLLFLAQGLGNQEIADATALSVESVRNNIRLLIQKLPFVSDRVDLIIWAWVHLLSAAEVDRETAAADRVQIKNRK